MSVFTHSHGLSYLIVINKNTIAAAAMRTCTCYQQLLLSLRVTLSKMNFNLSQNDLTPECMNRAWIKTDCFHRMPIQIEFRHSQESLKHCVCLCNTFFLPIHSLCTVFFSWSCLFRVRGYPFRSIHCLKCHKYITFIVSMGYIDMCSIMPAEAPANIVTDSRAFGKFS